MNFTKKFRIIICVLFIGLFGTNNKLASMNISSVLEPKLNLAEWLVKYSYTVASLPYNYIKSIYEYYQNIDYVIPAATERNQRNPERNNYEQWLCSQITPKMIVEKKGLVFPIPKEILSSKNYIKYYNQTNLKFTSQVRDETQKKIMVKIWNPQAGEYGREEALLLPKPRLY